MPTGPQRKKAINTRGPNVVHGQWIGGANYAVGEREQFRSQSHARAVMQSRIQGYDPISKKRTPLVEGSEMKLYRGAEDETPFRTLRQTGRGIRREVGEG
jgi:hypothetical protein